jgi:hypothetical protein
MTTHNGKKVTQRGGMNGEYGNMYAMLSGADMEYFKNRVPQKTSTKENTSCDSCGAGEGEGCSPHCLNQKD